VWHLGEFLFAVLPLVLGGALGTLRGFCAGGCVFALVAAKAETARARLLQGRLLHYCDRQRPSQFGGKSNELRLQRGWWAGTAESGARWRGRTSCEVIPACSEIMIRRDGGLIAVAEGWRWECRREKASVQECVNNERRGLVV
jgi:hypothetical protein